MNYMLQPVLQSVRHKSKPWKFISVWLMLTGFALCFDYQTASFFKSHQNLTPFMTFCDFMGGYSIHCLVFTMIVAISPKWRTVIEYVAAMSIPAAVCTIIKFAVGRARPDLHLGILQFAPFTFGTKEMDSFPSGQGTSAMALAAMLSIYFPKGKWAFYTLAVWAGLGRVARIRHFLSDTVFGAGLGILCVYLVFILIDHFEKSKTKAPLTDI